MNAQAKRRAVTLAAISLVSLTAIGLTAVSWPTKTTPTAASDPAERVPAVATVTPPPPGPSTFTVDPTLTPLVAEVEGLHEGDAPRPVGRLVTPDGTASDVVLDELAVRVSDAATLEEVAARLNGTVVDELGGGAYLLRIDPSGVDVSGLPADLESFEPVHGGENSASSDRTLQLLAALAQETADHGTEVALNWLTTSDDIADGRTIEGYEDNPNSFTWSYLTTGGEQDTGVSAAWQLLENHGKFDNKVEIMIDDGGFIDNKDFPATKEIRKAKWGARSPLLGFPRHQRRDRSDGSGRQRHRRRRTSRPGRRADRGRPRQGHVCGIQARPRHGERGEAPHRQHELEHGRHVRNGRRPQRLGRLPRVDPGPWCPVLRRSQQRRPQRRQRELHRQHLLGEPTRLPVREQARHLRRRSGEALGVQGARLQLRLEEERRIGRDLRPVLHPGSGQSEVSVYDLARRHELRLAVRGRRRRAGHGCRPVSVSRRGLDDSARHRPQQRGRL